MVIAELLARHTNIFNFSGTKPASLGGGVGDKSHGCCLYRTSGGVEATGPGLQNSKNPLRGSREIQQILNEAQFRILQ